MGQHLKKTSMKSRFKPKKTSVKEFSSEQRDALHQHVSHWLETMPRQQRQPLGLLQQLSLLMTGGVIVAGLVAGIGLWRSGTDFFNKARAIFDTASPPPKVDIRSVVVERVRMASDLTTAIFAMQAVVPTSRDRTLGGYVIGKTTLLYVAYGEVRAGVDLGKIQPQDVQVVDQQVHLRLPPPQILDSKIDVNRSNVYDYDRGFLGLGPDAAPELQQLAQQETLKRIVQTACSQGLLKEANERAGLVVNQLLMTAGYEHVAVETQDPAPDACPQP